MKKLILFTALITISLSCKKKEPEPTPPAPVTSIGAVYQGGIVFQLDEDGQHGLIITEQDIDTCKWTNEVGNASSFKLCFSQSFKDQNLGSGGQYVGAGSAFTQRIIDSLGTTGVYASKVCQNLVLNGYSDWYLPTYGELYIVINSGVITESTYTNKIYWTSYEENKPSALTAKIKSGGNVLSGQAYQKNVLLPVRAIRKF
ncbi:DUF1566 domain-containing protein [Fluviicola taffensis]|uniref:Vir region protein-like protein n=1 Tax=Fluviicola taffensis (strain DSM 16823 / NCIMB 13979 / RW262) TaxID=755732 RepID=F2IHC9_FLUTR|nr:DUF1566 domain-containing protein [Fluviicola taffensis]AEA42684.1 vir region protein-like protein [Fluviicola taffensis DSM 16823]